MNRKQRRAALKQSPSSAGAGNKAAQMLASARLYQQQNRLDEAARTYKRLLVLKPDDAESSNSLACVLQAQGKSAEASLHFARALELAPRLFEQFDRIYATLLAILPPLARATQGIERTWPQHPSLDQLLDRSALAAIANDPLLLTILKSSPVRDVRLERTLTALRAALLAQAAAEERGDDAALGLICALAQQCYINEYVFARMPEEDVLVDRLIAKLGNKSGKMTGEISHAQLAGLAMYLPLHDLPDAQAALGRAWPAPLDDVVAQQWREPMQERALRSTIPALTAIEDDVSLRVRQQYEENPYPRWVHAGGNVEAQTIDDYLRTAIPGAIFAPLGKVEGLDVLVAGCGTGSHPIELARKIIGSRVLAVDLSISSLAYAKRKTPASLAARLDYAQADILKLGAIDRNFDVVDASGVLHHMADPRAGLQTLLSLLRPGGLMHLGLYSETARRTVTAARKYIADQGYTTSGDDIRRARQDLLNSNLRSVGNIGDFYSTSECRDLLFHVQEHQLTIPKIGLLLEEAGLNLVGFVFDPPRAAHIASLFAHAGKSLTDLVAWHDFEQHHPETFAAMYQFWVQKPRKTTN